jgi:hypothetical protein
VQLTIAKLGPKIQHKIGQNVRFIAFSWANIETFFAKNSRILGMIKNYVKSPIYPIPELELIGYLRSINLYETRLAQQSIREKIAKPVKESLCDNFDFKGTELDASTLKKVINAVLTPGSVGEARTASVVSSLNLNYPRNKKLDSAVKISKQLRLEFLNARRAKVMLDNTSKYVNVILKYVHESSGKSNRNTLISLAVKTAAVISAKKRLLLRLSWAMATLIGWLG